MWWINRLREWWNPLKADPCAFCSNPDRKKLPDCRWDKPGAQPCVTALKARLR